MHTLARTAPLARSLFIFLFFSLLSTFSPTVARVCYHARTRIARHPAAHIQSQRKQVEDNLLISSAVLSSPRDKPRIRREIGGRDRGRGEYRDTTLTAGFPRDFRGQGNPEAPPSNVTTFPREVSPGRHLIPWISHPSSTDRRRRRVRRGKTCREYHLYLGPPRYLGAIAEEIE